MKQSENTVIKLEGISKKYVLHHEKPTLAESLFRQKEAFWALRNINFTLSKGKKIGIIGLNGAGKSTFLKIISGITSPTQGKATTHGKIASLIDLEAGFHPDLTGAENIYLNALLLGMSKNKIRKNFTKIVSFSGIGKFIDSPLHTYSTGMKIRLGFAVAAFSDPDILIIDEILAGGDEKFQRKSYVKIQEFFRKKKTILFASHSLSVIQKLCPQTLWLEKGKIKALGPSKEIIRQYQKANR